MGCPPQTCSDPRRMLPAMSAADRGLSADARERIGTALQLTHREE